MIDERAIIHPTARLADNVTVGPWSIIGEGVEIGEGTIINSHVVVRGPTRIGKNNHIYQFASIGEATPDLKYKNEGTRLEIGDGNVIREGVTIHRGTVQDKALTTVGNHNLIMAYAHIGHDCVVGSNCIMVNNAALAGHVELGDWVILSGYTLVHQHCRIGPHAFTGMGTAVGKDVPAYVTVAGNPATAHNINIVGLKRRGFSVDDISVLRKAYKIIYRQGLTLDEALAVLREMRAECEPVNLLIESLAQSQRGIVR